MLNYDHPLLDGLEGFWLPVHGRQGGSRLYDLSGYGANAEIVGLGHSWGVDSMQTALTFEAGINYARTDHVVPLSQGSALAAAVWVAPSSFGPQPCAFSISDNGSEGFFIRLEDDNQIWVRTLGSNNGGFGSLSVGEYVFIGVDWNIGVGYDLYVDGEFKQSTSTTDTSPLSSQSETQISAGSTSQLDTGEGGQLPGDYRFALMRTKLLGRTGHNALYAQARRGFPDVRSRRDQSALYVSAAGAVTAQQDETAELVLDAFSAEAQNQTPQAAEQDEIGRVSIIGNTGVGTNQGPQAANQDSLGILNLLGLTSNVEPSALFVQQGSVGVLSLDSLTSVGQTQSPKVITQDAPGIITIDGVNTDAQLQSAQLLTQDEIAILILQGLGPSVLIGGEEVTEVSVEAALKRTTSIKAKLKREVSVDADLKAI